MNPVPLAELRLRPRDHLSALWWPALLYRRPRVFQRNLEQLGRGQRFAAAIRLYLHGLPYVVVIAVLGRLLVFGAFGIALEHTPADLDAGSLVGIHVVWIAKAIASGIAVAITVGIAVGSAGGIAVGSAGGIAFGSASEIVGRIAIVHANEIAVWIGGGILVGIAGGIAFGITVGIAGGILLGIAFGIAVGIASTRAYYLLGHPFFVWPRLRGDSYALHPVAWDDLCGIPFPGLCRLLADYARFDPPAAETEIARLIDTSATRPSKLVRW